MAGFFLSIEGGEGVGKSLLTQGLEKFFRQNNIAVVKTFEPGGTPAADYLRKVFLNPPAEESFTPKTELFLVSAARAQHIERKLKPALERGDWIICDRYADSTRVYQGILNGLEAELVEAVIHSSTGGLDPHLTLLMDCDVGIALERVQQRLGEKSRFDAKAREFHEELRKAYLAIAKRFPQRIKVLDASQSPETLLKQALQFIEETSGRTLRK